MIKDISETATRYILSLLFLLSLVLAIGDYVQPFDNNSGELLIGVELEPNSEITIWNIGSNLDSSIDAQSFELPEGWTIINHGRGKGYKSINIKSSGNCKLSSIKGETLRIDFVAKGKGRINLSYLEHSKSIDFEGGKSWIYLGQWSYPDLVMRFILQFLFFSFIAYCLVRHLRIGLLKTVNVPVLLSVAVLLSVVNVLWLFVQAGSFTGDAQSFVNEARRSGGVSDLHSPFFLFFFKFYYMSTESRLYGIILLQLYAFTFSFYYFLYNLVLVSEPKTSVAGYFAPIVSLVCTLFILCNPVLIGFLTLLYSDPPFICLVLLGMGYFMSIVRKGKGSLKLLMVFLISCLLYRHNSIVLFPLALLLIWIARRAVNDKNNGILVVGFLKAASVFTITLFAASFLLNNFFVGKKTNYYIATPVYELVGLIATFKHLDSEDFDWMRNYMNPERIISRYGKQNALIPVLWEGNSRREVDLSAIYADHDKIWARYISIATKYPLELSYIKVHHFLLALGVDDFHPAPFFYDQVNKAYLRGESLDRLHNRGIYKVSRFGAEHDKIRAKMPSYQKGELKYWLSSALYPFLLSCIVVAIGGALWVLGKRFQGLSTVIVVALFNVWYMASYLIFSHGAFVKYGFVSYLVGVGIAFGLASILTRYFFNSIYKNLKEYVNFNFLI